ncbi:MAG TPA: HAD-IA family hydrolase [Actinomycetota bacterium]|nr:HAD-IA family hydrolase [Actinomycetota bacterium]
MTPPPERTEPALPLGRLDACIFDMDGVVTDTARTHFAAWKRMFDAFLEDAEPFTKQDYLLYVDGKTRYEGAESFLQARGVSLPWGSPQDAPGTPTVCGLANRKDAYFIDQVRSAGVDRYESTVALLHRLRASGRKTAVVSASRNATEVLTAARVLDLFDAKVDGVDADTLGLASKPDPALFLEACRRLDLPPGRAAVFEDALAGVAAGRRGEFGFVVGLDRAGQAVALREAGADVVVPDIEQLNVDAGT